MGKAYMHKSIFFEEAVLDEKIKGDLQIFDDSYSYMRIARNWLERKRHSFDEGDVLKLAFDLYNYNFDSEKPA
jgi:hypothetical protein